MKIKTVLTLLLAHISISCWAQNSSYNFSRAFFYDAIASDDLDKVEQNIKILEKTDIPEKEGFEGALLMKKAGWIKGLGEKLSVFKEGNKKLEGALSADPNNTEYRFLRLVIQENAPNILGYNNNLQEDSAHVRQGYASLPSEVIEAIVNYSKESKYLQLDEVREGSTE